MDEQFQLFDTTLRDGAQREGISFSVEDKLAISRLLDEYGVGFIEGGWPGAMPKDTEFFARAARELKLRNATLVAFGSTRKAGVAVADDPQVQALLDSGAPVITLVAKSDIRHVHEALRTTPEENLAMVTDTVKHLLAEGRRVFVDCEHFFDGYKHDADYAVSVARAALDAGAEAAACCPPGSRASSPMCAHASTAGSVFTARTTPGVPSRTRSLQSRPVPRMRSARPTATASGPATPTSSSWPRTSN